MDQPREIKLRRVALVNSNGGIKRRTLVGVNSAPGGLTDVVGRMVASISILGNSFSPSANTTADTITKIGMIFFILALGGSIASMRSSP